MLPERRGEKGSGAAAVFTGLALLVAGLASWWLSGLAMRPVLAAYRQQEQFTADAAVKLDGFKAGDAVGFTLTPKGDDYLITDVKTLTWLTCQN